MELKTIDTIKVNEISGYFFSLADLIEKNANPAIIPPAQINELRQQAYFAKEMAEKIDEMLEKANRIIGYAKRLEAINNLINKS